MTSRKLLFYLFSVLIFPEVQAPMMNRMITFIGILLAVAGVGFAQGPTTPAPLPFNPPVARTEAEKKILDVMDHMMKFNQTYLSVPPQDGEALRLLVEAADAKNVVEIGTSTGYSGLWFCSALQKTGGHLTTFEINHERATMARGHFQDAGVENLVTIVEGDAHEQVAKLNRRIDVVFIDADKPGYVDYLNKVLPLVRPGGLILAHNVDMVPDYVKAVTTSPDLETIFFMQGRGLAVTLRRR
jgi:predicted O-methyltransferase YrrM